MPLTCQTSSGSVQRLPERPDFCPRYLDAAEVLDLRRVDDTDAVPGFMECDRQAIAVATGGFQAGMHLADPEILQPAQQGLPSPSLLKILARRRVFQVSATSNFCLAMSMPSQAKPVIPMY